MNRTRTSPTRMRSRRRPWLQRWRRDEGGISAVLGAVLLLAVFISFLTVVQVAYVPVWEEDAEALHLRQAGEQLAALDAQWEQQVSLDAPSAYTQPLTLSPAGGETRLGVFRPATLPGELSIRPGDQPSTVSTNRFLLQDDGTSRFFVLNEDWVSFDSGDRAEDVDDLLHLRMRIVDPAQYASGGGGGTHEGTITVIDNNGTFAGSITVGVGNHPSGYTVYIRVLNADSETILDQTTESFFQQDQPAFYWVDILDEGFFVESLLSAADGPIDLLLSNNDIDAEYAITFASESGGVLVGSGGVLRSPYQRVFAGGAFELHANTLQLPERTLRFEHGGVISAQADGAAFLIPPEFQVRSIGSIAELRMELASLQGDPDQISSTGQALLRVTPSADDLLRGQAPRWSIDLDTDYPALWTSFWEQELQSAGFTSGAGEYSITSTADSVSLTFYGPTTDPASTVYDIAVTLTHRQATLSIEG